MATTLKARSGSALKVEFRYQDTEGDLVSTDGYTVRIQVRAAQPPRRVLIDEEEYNDALPSPPGTVLTQTEDGVWELFLGKSTVDSLPPTVVWELEMESDTDPEDVVTLKTGTILTEPQSVIEVL